MAEPNSEIIESASTHSSRYIVRLATSHLFTSECKSVQYALWSDKVREKVASDRDFLRESANSSYSKFSGLKSALINPPSSREFRTWVKPENLLRTAEFRLPAPELEEYYLPFVEEDEEAAVDWYPPDREILKEYFEGRGYNLVA
jgi:hypothetical protein